MVDRRVAVFAFVAAVAAFCIVQDRLTAAGARKYVSLQPDRRSVGEGGPAEKAEGGAVVTIDAVMAPAIRESVVRGALWAGVAALVVLAGGAALPRRTRRG